MEFRDIVDEKGKLLGKLHEKEGKEDFKEGEYHVIVHVWMRNSKGEILISKRSKDKKVNPEKWEMTSGDLF